MAHQATDESPLDQYLRESETPGPSSSNDYSTTMSPSTLGIQEPIAAPPSPTLHVADRVGVRRRRRRSSGDEELPKLEIEEIGKGSSSAVEGLPGSGVGGWENVLDVLPAGIRNHLLQETTSTTLPHLPRRRPLASRSVSSSSHITTLPSLLPPPNFAEQFKYRIVSSTLLNAAPSAGVKGGGSEGERESGRSRRGRWSGSPVLPEGVEEGKNPEISLSIPTPMNGSPPLTADTGKLTTTLQPPTPRRSSFSSTASSDPDTPSPTTTTDLALQELRSRRRLEYFFAALLTLRGLSRMVGLVGWIWLEMFAAVAVLVAGGLRAIVGERNIVEGRRRRRGRVERSRERRRRGERERRIEGLVEVAEREMMAVGKGMVEEEVVGEVGEVVVGGQEKEKKEEGEQSLQGMSLESLTTYVQETEGLDELVAMALSLIDEAERSQNSTQRSLGTLDPALTPLQPLRQLLHTTFTSLSKHVSDSAQTLLPLISEEDLAALSEMYSIGETKSFFFVPKRTDVSDDSGEGEKEEAGEDEEEVETPTSPVFVNRFSTAPRTRSRDSGGITVLSPDGSPLRTSRSFSHISLSNGLSQSQNDRFTPLPPRSPRLSGSFGKRSSWTGEDFAPPLLFPSSGNSTAWRGVGLGLGQQVMSTPPRPGRFQRWPSAVVEREEAEDEDVGMKVSLSDQGGMGAPGLPMASSTPPRIVNPPRNTHKLKELRLSQSGITSFAATEPALVAHGSPSVTDHAALGSPYHRRSMMDPETSRRKRSSLQEMGYRRPLSYHSLASSPRAEDSTPRPVSQHEDLSSSLLRVWTDEPTIGGNLSRTRSMPGRRGGHSPSRSVPIARAGLLSPPQQDSQLPFPGLARTNSGRSEAFSESQPSHRSVSRSRADSLNPLTLSALRASFLGLHLKRRRTVCCLLALQFDNAWNGTNASNEGTPRKVDHVEVAKYWGNVFVLLDDLRTAYAKSKSDLIERLPTSPASSYPSTFLKTPVLSNQTYSFAPRTPDTALLEDDLASLLSLLSTAQEQVLTLKSGLVGDPGTLAEAWEGLRGVIGGQVREWEKGRVVISRMMKRASVSSDSPVELAVDGEKRSSRDVAGIPDFAKSWTQDENHQADHTNTSIELDDPTTTTTTDDASSLLLDSTSPAFLPPPGIEAIFEGLSGSVAPRAVGRARLSREERITAQKAERAAKESGKAEGKGAGVRAGEVVDELKGFFGEMRRRRGMMVENGEVVENLGSERH